MIGKCIVAAKKEFTHFVYNITAATQKYFVQVRSSIFAYDNISSEDIREFFIVVAVVLALNLFYLANFSISIDDEIHAIMPSSVGWLSIGRWTTAIIEHFLFPRPVVPYSPYLFFSICLALSYSFLIRSHNLNNSNYKYLALPVFIVHPIWQFLTGFDATLPAIGVGLVLVTFSCLLFERTRHMLVKKVYVPLFASVGLQSILLAAAIASYQSFLLMYLAVVFGILLIKVIDGEKETHSTLVQGFVQIAIVSVLGFLVYQYVGLFARWITNTSPSYYIERFYIRLDLSSVSSIIQFLSSYLNNMYLYYSGDASRFGVNFSAFAAVTVLSALFTFQRLWREGRFARFWGISFWFMVVASPFLFSLFLVTPSRTLFPIAYVAWLMAILLLKARRKFILWLNFFIILFFVVQGLNINGLYSARSIIAQRYDSLLAADIYKSLGSVDPDFDRGQPIFIDVYGTINFGAAYPSPWSGTIGVSFFDWDGGNLGRIVLYMELMGYLNVKRLPDEQRIALTPEFEKMPAWPAAGFVKKIGNVYLVKLSDSPDSLHKLFYSLK